MEVTLAMPHTHAGREYPAGATITVSPRQAAWLREMGVSESAAKKKGGK